MEYPKQLLGQFKNDYQRHGQFNLEVQVPHLERLAGFYERRYKVTKNWTDCLKAHALYNSINRRQPQPLWEERAFEVQQEYWADKSSFSLDQQRALTCSLKCELEAIRKECRDDVVSLDGIANKFDGAESIPDVTNLLFDCASQVSVNCSNKMANFAGRIVRESVEILKVGKPPCDFVAIAIGSLARDEATPYSDLEFFFLVTDKTPEIVQYFENLALATYFLIGNLGETKLSYMSIKELRGWFNDQAKNGFKIDGLTDQAGNIPTGNGSSNPRYHLIVTPDELVGRYREISDEPDERDALKGDLTAMLKYMKPIFHSQGGMDDIFDILQTMIQRSNITPLRHKVNCEMLKADVRKFDFLPSIDLLRTGFTADVKREIYRFPSIFLLDINIVANIDSTSAWLSPKLLYDNQHISAQVYNVLKLLLSAAAYMRLAAYLHHDSQDDRISFGEKQATGGEDSESVLSAAHGRWFVPIELLVAMCTKLISLKRKLVASDNIMLDLKDLDLEDDYQWGRITTLFSTGRYTETLALLKGICGDHISYDPISIVQNIPSGQDVCVTLDIVAETLLYCEEYVAALILYKHLTEQYLREEWTRIARCYTELGCCSKAVDLLESIATKSPGGHFILGRAYSGLKDYKKAEQSHLRALELSCCSETSEQFYDYDGDPIVTDELTDVEESGSIYVISPEERLSRITNSSHNVITSVFFLGEVYSDQRRHKLSNEYYKKVIHLSSEFNGAGAAVHADIEAAALYNMANNFDKLGLDEEAIDHYKQAEVIYRKRPQRDNRTLTNVLRGLGKSLSNTQRYSEAMDYAEQALALCKELPEGSADITKRSILLDLGNISILTEQSNQAYEYFGRASKLNRKPSPGTYGDDDYHTAHISHNQGIVFNRYGYFSEAEDCNKQALDIYREWSQGRPCREVAETLCSLGEGYMGTGQFDESEDCYRQALGLYRRFSEGINTSRIATILNKLGNICSWTRKYSEAADFYKETVYVCRELSKGVGNLDIAKTIVKLGTTYTSIDRHLDATNNLKQALVVYREISQGGKIAEIANILNNLGISSKLMGQYSKAEYYHEQAIAVYKGLSADIGSTDVAETLFVFGKLYLEGGYNANKAIGKLREAVHMYIRVHAGHYKIREIWDVLSQKLDHFHLI